MFFCRSLASTQFSPIDARRAFPCFDRPDKKAKFNITLVKQMRQLALSNREELSLSYTPDIRPGYVRVSFAETPKMSTYLVAFIVADNLVPAKNLDVLDDSLPEINIYTRPEVTNMTSFAHGLTINVLTYLNSYFGIPYDLPKIDLVAVPDFGFSAMENWGLITFR